MAEAALFATHMAGTTAGPVTTTTTARDPAGVDLVGLAFTTLILALFATHLDLWLNETGRLPVNLVHLLLAAIGACGLLVVLSADLEDRLRHLLATLGWAVLPLGSYIAWIALHVVFLGRSDLPANQELARVLPFLQFATLFLGMALATRADAARTVRIAAALALLVLTGSILVDAQQPGTFSIHEGRAAGFGMDANVSAACLTMLLALALRHDRITALNLVLLPVSLVAVFFTFSRGGLLQWVAVLAVHLGLLVCAPRETRGSLLRLALPVAVLVVGGLLFAAVLGGAAILELPTVQARLDQILLRGDQIGDDDSRLVLALYYLDLVVQAPWLGHGTGHAIVATAGAPFGQGPHNMFLRVWVDHGLPGLLTYLGLFLGSLHLFVLRRCGAGLAFVASWAVYNFVSHTAIDDKTFLLALGLAYGLAALPMDPRGSRR